MLRQKGDKDLMFTEIVKDEFYRGYRVLVKKIEHNLPLAIPFDYWYCGYVEVPQESRFYQMNYDEANNELTVHGGITFSSRLAETDKFAFGFDCYHIGDTPEVQNIEFTLKECYKLVDQMIEIDYKEALTKDELDLKVIMDRVNFERTTRLPFWQQIIEDITGFDMKYLSYDKTNETLEALWINKDTLKLIININGDSLRSCTHDVIRQTYSWIESQIAKEVHELLGMN